MDGDQSKKFRVLPGKSEEQWNRLNAHVVLDDPETTLEKIDDEVFRALVEEAIDEQREEEALESGQFTEISDEIREVIARRVVDRMMALLVVNPSPSLPDATVIRPHLENLLENYLRNVPSL
ncbi:MAG: hypothetical protein AAB855_00235 [Patescibacteria group bacterium]